MRTHTIEADAVIVGSGPGGSTVAKQLSEAGKEVVLLEKGRDLKMIGNHLSALIYADKMGLSFTEEGLNIVRAMITGGSTILYCGSATPPPDWFQTEYGIDLTEYTAETIKELNLTPLPDEVVGQAAHRIMESANELGYEFEKFKKFIDPEKCRMKCGGTCMLGCPYGAKWSAREYIDDMKEAGGQLFTRADVQHVTVEDGKAVGVVAVTPKSVLHVKAEIVIISAGGVGTPTILQKSGLHDAGIGMFIDPLVFVSGISRFEGNTLGPPMAVGSYKLLDEGILLSDLIDPWGMWLMMALLKNPTKLHHFFHYRQMLSLMVKIGDERKGFITMDGQVSKPLSDRDRYRMNRGASIAREILIKAGCRPDSIIVGPIRGAHPGATARIGDVVDTNLETKIKNLFVSDASVIPDALDRPVVLTLISLAKRLSEYLVTERMN